MSRIHFDLDVMRSFVTGIELGSFAKAADRLSRSTSAVSAQLKKLEEQAGTPLFERMPRGMILTEAGELLVQHARRALMDGDAILDEISEMHALKRGNVRIGCTEGFTRCFLPSVMATHYREHPHTRFAMRSGSPAQVEHWVASGEVDVGLAFSTSTSTALSVEYSVKAPVCALLPPTHPLAGKPSITLDDILEYPTAVLDRGTTVRQLVDWCCSARGVHLEPVLTSNNSSAMHHFAALTGAITLGSAVALEGDPGPPTLVATAIDEPLLNERLLQVTVMRERRLPPAVDQFLKSLSNALRDSLGKPGTRARKKQR